MRWSRQQVQDDGVGTEQALPGLRGLLRSVRTPEFAGAVFHEVEARSVLNRVPGGSPVPFRWTVNPYRGCSHACVYCLAGPTRVLMADGSTRPIAQLRVGDAVMGTERVDGLRRYVATEVVAHWSTRRPAVRLRLSGGTEIVASGEHRFLTERGWRHVTGGWCRSGRRPRLREGDMLLGPGAFGERPAARHTAGYRRGYLCGLVRGDGPSPAQPDRCFPSDRLALEVLGRAHHFMSLEQRRSRAPAGPTMAAAGRVVDGRIAPPADHALPREPDRVDTAIGWPRHAGEDWCAGFLAGLLDARGSVARGELRIGHTDEEVVGRVAGALHRLGFRFAVEPGEHGERVVRLAGGPGELVRLVALAGPAVRRDVGGAPVGGAARVVAVEPLGRTEAMYDITTDTGDFVAEGVVSHNCFARGTHTYLDLDAGADFDSQIVVKVNVARVLERELSAPRWAGEPVAMGTNTDPYQRAEGRYRLMPGVIGALARSGTPFSLLTKGTVLTRDLPLLTAAAADVPVGLGVSIALLDRGLQAGLEPGTPSPEARLDLVRRIADAGLPCGVMVAPVLPLLTDSTEALDALLGRIAAAGATGASVLALHLRPGTREWFLAWLAREHPRLVEPYGRLYRRGPYVDAEYRRALGARVAPLLRRHGLASSDGVLRGPPGASELARAAVHSPQPEQLTLL
ncbi:intein-containing Rv2578c family radical SAM protein [Pseudonocardia sp.]|uniref:intein-containing Rv2578c family radical SAM protein n=1 Tax=Pseudonocardia sp. TaxID=60912 RepID=UPI00262D3E36|nr:intein-containing Rv2578c family radical SAM protein [Pseudonocardia sp.]